MTQDDIDSHSFEAPTFECVLDNMEDDTNSLPPPPPTSSKRGRKGRGLRNVLRPTSKSPPPNDDAEDMEAQYQLEDLHNIRETIPEYEDEDAGSVEYSDAEYAERQNSMAMIPPVPDDDSASRGGGINRGRRRLCMAGLLCLLVAGVVLGVVFGVRAANDSQPRTASAGLIDGSATATDPPTGTPVVLTEPPADEEDATEPPADEEDLTEPPADEETEPPVAEEPEEPCVDSITVAGTCFETRTTVTIAFNQCEPLEGDWVAIYPASSDASELLTPNPTAWQWACGTNDCVEAAAAGSVELTQTLSAGTYVAHLLRNETEPYSSYVGSDSFEIAEEC